MQKREIDKPTILVIAIIGAVWIGCLLAVHHAHRNDANNKSDVHSVQEAK